jgi:hypothetical protein
VSRPVCYIPHRFRLRFYDHHKRLVIILCKVYFEVCFHDIKICYTVHIHSYISKYSKRNTHFICLLFVITRNDIKNYIYHFVLRKISIFLNVCCRIEQT